MAWKQGFFKENGLNVAMKFFANGYEAQDAMIAGQLQFAGSGTGTVLPRVATGKSAIIATTASSKSAFALTADKSITSPRDFIGKKIGTIEGTTMDYALQVFLEKNDIARDQVSIVYAGAPELTTSIVSGRLNATYLFTPWPTKQTQLSDKIDIFATNGEAGFILYFVSTGNVEWMRSHPDLTTAYLKALKEGCDYIKSHKQESVSIMADVMHESESSTASQMSHYSYDLQAPSQAVIRDAHEEAAWLKGQKKLTHSISWDEAFAPQYIQGVGD